MKTIHIKNIENIIIIDLGLIYIVNILKENELSVSLKKKLCEVMKNK